MAIVLEHLIIHANVISDGLELIVQLTVGVIIIQHAMNGLVHVTSVKIGPLDSFVNIASKSNKFLKKISNTFLLNNYFLGLEVMAMQHR